jgi:hypothetical protein
MTLYHCAVHTTVITSAAATAAPAASSDKASLRQTNALLMSHLHEPLKGTQLVALRDALASSLLEVEALLGLGNTPTASTATKVCVHTSKLMM